MKKVISLIMIFCIAISLFGCGSGTSNVSNQVESRADDDISKYVGTYKKTYPAVTLKINSDYTCEIYLEESGLTNTGEWWIEGNKLKRKMKGSGDIFESNIKNFNGTLREFIGTSANGNKPFVKVD